MTATFVSMVFLGATVYAYAMSEELRTVTGKSIMMFTISLMLVVGPITFMDSDLRFIRRFTEFSMSTGFLMTFLWFNVLAFDCFWTFKNFRVPSETFDRFRFYCFYVFGLPAVFFLLLWIISLTESHPHHLLFCLVAIFFCGSAALDVIFLLVTGYFIFQLSKGTTTSEHSRFETERDR